MSQPPADPTRVEPGWAREAWHARRWLRRGHGPLDRLRLSRELARRRVLTRGRLLGEPLQMLREDRLRIGPHTLLEPDVWLTGSGRITIGAGTFLNLGVMVASLHDVTIGDHCMLANGCVVTDADHAVADPHRPVTEQGFVSRGPTSIGDDCWLGAHVVVTSGVTIGERCVIGANSTVTHDVPAWSVAVGSPARVVRSLR